MPMRIGVSRSGSLAPLHYATGAARAGILYTRGDGDSFEVPEGRYSLHATRGMEWSLGRAEVSVRYGKTSRVKLTLRREVDTKGFVAADTHIHTVTFSGHGDATIHERMLTLAGEGVELAIATDHNHNTDYGPIQSRMKLNRYFTPVIGNEVTTRNGHFNAFPLKPKDKVPPHWEKDWGKLVAGIRAKGAKVVILNHPHWPSLPKSPFGVFGLDPATGDRRSGTRFTFDAMELVNSSTYEKEPLPIFADWFALLNRGERITGVGSSDSHTVWDPVGQGRTYVRSSTDDPSKINVDEACRAFLRGDVSVSQGIFADVTVNGRRMGEVANASKGVKVKLRVDWPSWVTPRKALVYLNGEQVAERPAARRIELSLSAPKHDAHLVCVVLGDPVNLPGWTTMNEYTLAATNPVFLDVDRNGYRSPRETARRKLKGRSVDPDSLKEEDSAIRIDSRTARYCSYSGSALRHLAARTFGGRPTSSALLMATSD